MMRPACAYPPTIQPGLPNGPPDMYRERDGFGFAISANQPPSSMYTMPSAQGLYPMHAGGPTNQTHAVVGNSPNSQHFQPQQHSSFPLSAYSQLPVQATYSTQLPTDVMQPGQQLAHPFQTQAQPNPQQQQSYQTVGTPVSDKLVSPNTLAPVGYPRDQTGAGGGSMNQPNSYGLIQGPGLNTTTVGLPPSAQQPSSGQQRLPSNNGAVNGRGVPQNAQMAARIGGTRPNHLPIDAISQQSVYATQQPRLPNVPASYANTGGYLGPHYVPSCPPSSVQQLRSVNLAPPGSMIQRPQTSSSPQLSKERSNCGGGLHAGVQQSLSQQQQQQVSHPPSGSPNPCSTYVTSNGCKPMRPSGNGLSTGAMFNPNCGMPANMVGTSNSITPPGGMIVNGPSPQLGQPTMMNPMNGCLTTDGGIKLNSGLPDGCYIQNRPMSSVTRDPTMSGSMAVSGGHIGSGPDVLISSAFPASNSLNVPASMNYASNQPMSVLPGDFDGMGSNPSPMMMMTTMPVSSPIPGPGGNSGVIATGGTLGVGGASMNGTPLPPGVMNVAMANSTPAPPPYHHPTSLANCRTMGPGSGFFGPSTPMPPMVTVTTNVHTNVVTPANMATLQDGSSLPGDCHFLGMAGEPMSNNAIPKPQVQVQQSTTGTTKSTARPKRTRVNKNASGTGRNSKQNAKKGASATNTQSTINTPVATDPFAMNVRMPTQQPGRQPMSPWGMGPSNVAGGFPTGMQPQQLGGPPGGDLRIGCISPASFPASSNAMLMRPNSGPPLNPNGCSMMPTGPPDPQTRLPSSPRMYSTIPSQQQPIPQHYPNASMSNPMPATSSGGGSFSMGISNHPCPMSLPSTNGSLPTPQSTGYPGGIPSSGTRLLQTSGHIQSHQLGPAQQSPVSSQVPNRTLAPTPTSGMGEAIEPRSCTGLPPYSSPSTTGVYPPDIITDTDRLVCPITNGMVWGPTQLQISDVMHKFLPEGAFVLRFEFDLTANHLNTIVGRSDLDIVVCSHLLNEPLQVCHWPSDSVQIRFNEYLLRLDRSCVANGQSAHKVACVKQLCRPGRNQLEIAILGLGEDPSQPSTLHKRRTTAALLETHQFAAFMAHMPALNVLLDGLKRRRPAGVSALCEILEGRVGIPNPIIPERTIPIVAELSLICPVFRTRMHVPGRITGCEHVEAFDMEAFLRREVLWPRLNCPICGHKSPAGLDGLCIDTTILNAIRLVPPTVESFLVRSDGYWRLPPPICLDLPPEIDQWQPLIGPLSELVTHAFTALLTKRGGMHIRGPLTDPSRLARMPSTGTTASSVSLDWTTTGQRASPITTTSTRPLKSTESTPQTSAGKDGLPSDPTPTSTTTIVSTGVTSRVSPWFGTSASPMPDKAELDGGKVSSPASCPASQPMSWLGRQTSPSESNCVGIGQSSSQSPKLLLTDAPNHNQSDSTTAGAPSRSASQPSKPSGDSIVTGDVAKIRRSSTGSTRSGPLGAIQALSTVPEYATVPPMQLGWSNPNSATNSPNCSVRHLGTKPSASLPTSPALDSRSTASFPIPPIPGVNAIEHISTSPAQRVPTPIQSTLVGGTEQSDKANADQLSFDTGSPSPNLTAITAEASSSVCKSGTPEESNASPVNSLDASDIPAGTDSTIQGQIESDKKPCSSLNMGLDFLLTEERSATQSPQTRDTSSIHSKSELSSSDSGLPSTNGTSNEPNSNKRTYSSSSASSGSTPSTGGVDGMAGALQFNSTSDVWQCGSDSSNGMPPDSDPITTNGHSEASVKRIKLEQDNETCSSSLLPSDTKSHVVESSVDKDDDYPKQQQHTINDVANCKLEEDKFKVPHQSPKPSDSPVVGSTNQFSYKSDNFDESTTTITTSSSLNSITDSLMDRLAPVGEDEKADVLCDDSITCLSAQVDRMEIFLDESYIRFVKRFPCA